MSNIQKACWRHIWDNKKLCVGFKNDWKEMLHCRNCRMAWDYQLHGSPPLTGCIADVDISKLGRAAADEYRKDEERRLKQQELYT